MSEDKKLVGHEMSATYDVTNAVKFNPGAFAVKRDITRRYPPTPIILHTAEIMISVSGAHWTIKDRGEVYEATIMGFRHGHEAEMEEVSRMLVGQKVPGIGTVAGVEMFCGRQIVGSSIGVLIKEAA